MSLDMQNKVMWLTDLMFSVRDCSPQIKEENFMLNMLICFWLSGVKRVYSIIHILERTTMLRTHSCLSQFPVLLLRATQKLERSH